MIIGGQVGVLNFIATVLIIKQIPLLRCQNLQTQSALQIAFISVFCFTNGAVIPLLSTNLGTFRYLVEYGQAVYLGMIMTSFLPYIVPLIGMIYKIIKKKEPPLAAKRYPMEQKYALSINTIWICFFFGAAQPLLLVIGALSFSLQYIFDRLLITYWYE